MKNLYYISILIFIVGFSHLEAGDHRDGSHLRFAETEDREELLEYVQSRASGMILFDRYVNWKSAGQTLYSCLFYWGENSLDDGEFWNLIAREDDFELIHLKRENSAELNLILMSVFQEGEVEVLGSLSSSPSRWHVYWFDDVISEETRTFKEDGLFDNPYSRPELMDYLFEGKNFYDQDYRRDIKARLRQNLSYMYLGNVINELLEGHTSDKKWFRFMFE